MKVSLSWLKEYVTVEMETKALADAFTMAGLEVDAVTDRYEYVDNIVIGYITGVSPHPNADRLQLCEVDVGNKTVSVVCGAQNVKEDIFVPVALSGTSLPNGMVIEKNLIRGQHSEGMICSEVEMGIGPDGSGIKILEGNLSAGMKLSEAIDISDTIIEVDLTPNRSDCLSILGVAREAAVFNLSKIKYPEITLPGSHDNIKELTSVKVENPELCPRYAARLIFDIKVGPSPFWLQDRLMSIGMRPINNIVDITNFVMMETGQPLHAFDYDRLAENRIVVRCAKDGEKFTTLDQKERSLTNEMLMICDGEKPVAIGGVMGGLNSEIDKSTTRVLLESAYFNPVSIRKTSKALGLNTDATHRFERGVDPDGTIRAINRASQLIVELGGGLLIDGIIDQMQEPVKKHLISLGVKDTNRLLGTNFGLKFIKGLLESIEFKVEPKDDISLDVYPPSFRVDISRPEDLIEEVARLSGYNNIPVTFPQASGESKKPSKTLVERNRVKNIMLGFGFTEVINYSFIHNLSCDHLKFHPDDPKRNMVEILNPLTEDQTVMRTSLVPGLLGTMNTNISQQTKNLKIFEIGKIFLNNDKDSLPEEIEIISGLWTGSCHDASWHSKEKQCDFYDIKGVLEGMFNNLKIDNIIFTKTPEKSLTFTKTGYSADIYIENELVGIVGEVDQQVLSTFGLKQNTFVFELNLDSLIRLIPDNISSKPIPRFPAVFRDSTIIIDNNIEATNIKKHIDLLKEDLVESIRIFDIYEGKPISKGNKSISFRVTYRSDVETLEDDYISELHKNITYNLIKELGASLPGDQ